MMRRENGKVFIELSEAQSVTFFFALGMATRAALESRDEPSFERISELIKVLRGWDTYAPAPSPSFKLGVASEVEYIECLVCGARSYNPNDVAAQYCDNCHTFHKGF